VDGRVWLWCQTAWLMFHLWASSSSHQWFELTCIIVPECRNPLTLTMTVSMTLGWVWNRHDT
jgi:hypothetical protein